MNGPCPTCGDPIHEHLVSKWLECAGRPSFDLPYEDVSEPLTINISGESVTIVDTLVCRSILTEAVQGVAMPGLLLAFSVGSSDGPDRKVVEVCLLAGDGEMMRKFGKALRDGAFGAANSWERSR